ncbi:GDP-mannose 4,6-dehydratase [compost metagenome]
MNVFIIGITGNIGGLLAQRLVSKGDTVHGLVRRYEQQAELGARGINTAVGDLANMSVDMLADAFSNADAIVSFPPLDSLLCEKSENRTDN